MKNTSATLLLAVALGLTLAGCSKPDPSAADGTKPVEAAAKKGNKELPPPMPGAVPFKAEAPAAPDAAALQKAIDAQLAEQAKAEKEAEKASAPAAAKPAAKKSK